MLFATASHAALERSSTGRTRTWLRTPTRPLSRLYPWNVVLLRSMLCGPCGTLERLSPALGLDIVHMGVLAHLDGRNGAPDVHAVLDHGVVALELSDRELVADGDIVLRMDLDVLVLVHDPAGQLLPRLHALDDDHSDGVVFIVHYEMNHRGPSATAQVTRIRINGPCAILDVDLAVGVGFGCPDRRLAVRAEPVVPHAVGKHHPDDDRVAERRAASDVHLGGGDARTGGAFLGRIPDRAARQSNRDDDATRPNSAHRLKISTRRSVSPYSGRSLC